jgi:hypothetical protein
LVTLRDCQGTAPLSTSVEGAAEALWGPLGVRPGRGLRWGAKRRGPTPLGQGGSSGREIPSSGIVIDQGRLTRTRFDMAPGPAGAGLDGPFGVVLYSVGTQRSDRTLAPSWGRARWRSPTQETT